MMNQNNSQIKTKHNNLLCFANEVLNNADKDLLPPDYDQTECMPEADLQEDEASYRPMVISPVEEMSVDSTESKSAVLENSLSGVSRLPCSFQRTDAEVTTLEFQPVKPKSNLPNEDKQKGPEHPLSVSPCGKYLKFGTVIGRGAVKTVFRGFDSQKRIPIAWCEIIRSEWKEKDRKHFRDEAQFLSFLSHPNILSCCSYWEGVTLSDPWVLITEYMTYGTLKSYIRRFKKINLRIAKSWCIQILKGLKYLHSKRPAIIHRDLKCDNIFVQGASGCIKIGDLGLATRLVDGCATSLVGTPEFMPAEMYDGHYDESVDIYGFGMCMIEILTSEYPYSECLSINEIHRNVTSGIQPNAYFKIKDPTASSIVRSCIQMNRYNRPTCAELLKLDFFGGNTRYAGRDKPAKKAKMRRQRLTFSSTTSRVGPERRSGPTTSGLAALPSSSQQKTMSVTMGVDRQGNES